MSLGSNTSPGSSVWIGLEDISSFDGSPYLQSPVDAAGAVVTDQAKVSTPSGKRILTLQNEAKYSGAPAERRTSSEMPLHGNASHQLSESSQQQAQQQEEQDDEMLLELATDCPEPRSWPSTPVSSPQDEARPSPTLFTAAPASSAARPTALQPTTICTICQYSFTEMPGSTPVLRLSRCGHTFCKQHINAWFENGQRNSCPNCQCTYPSLRGRTQEMSAEELVQRDAAARHNAEFTVGADVMAEWDADGHVYPAAVVSVGEEMLTVRWKDGAAEDRNVRFDQVTIDSVGAASIEQRDEEVEITIKQNESGKTYPATVHETYDGRFAVHYTDADQICRSETLTSSQLLRRSKDFSVCMVCGGCHSASRSLLCDGCESMCHLECADPPLKVVPVGQWFCNRALCRRKKEGLVRRGESAAARSANLCQDSPPTAKVDPVGKESRYVTSPRNQRLVKRLRTSFQVNGGVQRAYVMHTGPGDSYHVHFLGWNSRYDESWTKAMCKEKLKDWVDDAPETCSVCGDIGFLLVCDCCDANFHLTCLSPELTRVPDGKWYCASSMCQMKLTVEKYCAQFDSLNSLRAAANARLLFAGGSFAEICDRLARNDLKLPPSSPLEAAHAAYPVKARVNVNFKIGWYQGWVERHTDKCVGVRFDNDEYYTVPLLEKPKNKGHKPVKRCDWLLRSLESDVEGVVEATMQLLIDELEDCMKARPFTETLTDVLRLVMDHEQALDLEELIKKIEPEVQVADQLIVKPIMDLPTVKRNLDAGQYSSADEFTRDVLSSFVSCRHIYCERTPITKCTDALERCFKELMYSFGFDKVFQDAERKMTCGANDGSKNPSKRKSVGKPAPQQAKRKASELGPDQQLVKDRQVLLKKVERLGKHVYDQVQSCLDAPTTAVKDNFDEVALGARLLKGNGELIEEFTEIVLRRKQLQPGNEISHRSSSNRRRLTTFSPDANRYIEYLPKDRTAPLPTSRLSSTSISFRPSQIITRSPQVSSNHSTARLSTGPVLPEQYYTVATFMQSKAQVPAIGMGLRQQWRTESNGERRPIGPIVVAQCSPGTVAFNAGVRNGMELVRFQSVPQSMSIEAADFTCNGIMETMRVSDRPWILTFYAGGAHNTPWCLPTQSGRPGAILAFSSSQGLPTQQLVQQMQRQNTSNTAASNPVPGLAYSGPSPNIRSELHDSCSAAEEGSSLIPTWANQLLLDQNHGQCQACLALEAFVFSQKTSGALHARQVDEEKLESIVANLIASGALVLLSADPVSDTGSLCSDSADDSRTGLAVFVKHAVLKYVLYCPSSIAGYSLYLSGARTLDSVTSGIKGKPTTPTSDDCLVILDAVQVATRVSPPTKNSNLARLAYNAGVLPTSQNPSNASFSDTETSAQHAAGLHQYSRIAPTQSTQNYVVLKRRETTAGVKTTADL